MSVPAHNGTRSPAGTPLDPGAFHRLMLQLTARIDCVVDEENAALAAAPPQAIDHFGDRKSHLALELMRLAQHAGSTGMAPETAARVRQTRAKLADNAARLKRHIEAIQEITATLAQVHDAYASDGTYTRAVPLGSRIR